MQGLDTSCVPMALLTTSGTPERGTEKVMTLVSPFQGLMLASGSPSSLWYSCRVPLLSKTSSKYSCMHLSAEQATHHLISDRGRFVHGTSSSKQTEFAGMCILCLQSTVTVQSGTVTTTVTSLTIA